MSFLWGIDVGGTKLEGVALRSAQDAEPLCRIRIPTEAALGYEHILSRLAHLVLLMREKLGAAPCRIGFGTPGVLDPQLQTMKNCNTTCLNGKPMKRDLEQLLKVEAIFCNDANCFALAENRFGAAKGAQSVFGIIMGTGVGGGVIIDGNVVHGCQGIAGEWGHNVIEEKGTPCYCGKAGCVESVFSGPALERFYEKYSGAKLSLEEIVARSETGEDSHAQRTTERLVTYFGRALSVVINILDPHVVVLGGGVSNVGLLYSRGIEEVRKSVFNNRLETQIVKHALGDSAGVFGAALLCAQNS